MDSILTTIKKLLGIDAEYTHFDKDIIIHINSVLMGLNQLGVGPKNPAFITSELETWSSILGETKNIEAVKSFVALKVRLLFDPPTNSSHIEAIERQIKELEFRLSIQVD